MVWSIWRRMVCSLLMPSASRALALRRNSAARVRSRLMAALVDFCCSSLWRFVAFSASDACFVPSFNRLASSFEALSLRFNDIDSLKSRAIMSSGFSSVAGISPACGLWWSGVRIWDCCTRPAH
ncbi:hypothetical protein N4Q68_28445 [Salmonella enterica subsp. enterica serovar Montevideo]